LNPSIVEEFLFGIDLLLKWKNKKFGFKLKRRFLSFRRGRRMVR